MRVDEDRAILARVLSPFAVVFTGLCLFAAPTVFAQDDSDSLDDLAELEDDSPVEEVVVTGSRLKRDTYSSISPLQVITGQVSREIGLIDPGTILQESTAASGVQIDLTFQGFVLDNGPGATTIDLRGLGAGRTLLLINGRRVSPAGVEGAPVSPDTTLLPGTLVQQYDVLLDGASSVYGSDAVSGVVNVVLRKDFDGLELEAFTSIPAAGDSAGLQNRISASWGYNGDRGFIGIGAEYRDWQPITLDDRDWTSGCDEHHEVTTGGQILNEGIRDNYLYEMRPNKCKRWGLAGRMYLFDGAYGSVYYTPGSSNTGIPNFSESGIFSLPASYGSDGYNAVSFNDYSINGHDGFTHMIPDIQTYSVMSYGEYTLSGEANITPYFEVLYAQRDSFQNEGAFQLFPDVPPNNPFNPCNPAAAGGVDCGDAYDALLRSPDFSARFAAAYGGTPQEYYDFGVQNFFQNVDGTTPLGPIWVEPIVNVRGDRTLTDVTANQTRIVAGVRGDMPFIDFGMIDNWSFDFYAMQSDSDGDSSRPGIRSDRMYHALGYDSATFTPCVDDFSQNLSADVTQGCVPVNMFAASLYAPVVGGDFATQAERDYLFDTRDFNTKYRQTIYSLYANGEVFDLPGGQALFGIGAEYREDEINSIPDEVAREGLMIHYFADGGAVGEKWTKEYFAELELPLLADVTAFKELTTNISTRHTEDEYYGKAWTYSGKLAWRPVDSLLLRGTVGTSYRAPNMRENFLLGQTGFLGLFDPCVIPEEAIDDFTGLYDPALDTRRPEVHTNCAANGIDSRTFDNNGISVYSTEVSAGGAVDVREETSESMSAGLTWEQPFFQSFDLIIGATYYEIDIRDEIIEPNAQFIINDCYNDFEGDSVFCSRIFRDPATGRFDIIDRGFINRDSKKARGVDLNMTIDYPTEMFGRAVDLQADFVFNRTLEVKDIYIGDDGNVTIDDDVGEFAYPEWKGRMSFRADVNDWRITWSTRYVSSVSQADEFVDDWGGVEDSFSDTCLGELLGGSDCRDVGYAENYFVHDMSVYYYGDKWTLGAGMRNVLNEEPPKVDSQQVFSFRNNAYGAGYDVLGRTLFLNAVFRWQ